MQTMTKKMLVGLGLAACTPVVFAAKPGTPTLADVLDASGVTVDGYLDTSYTYLSGSGTFTGAGAVANRVFDTERNSFNLNALNLRVQELPAKGFGGKAEVHVGSDAGVIKAFGSTTTNVDLTQAYVNYAAGGLTLMGGKFVTLAGAEVIRSPDDLSFSRSILFGYAIPFTHTGVRANFAVNDNLTFMAGVNNGWDVLKESASGDPAARKTVELGTALNPTKALAINAVYYGGDASNTPGTPGGVVGMRQLIDLVATFNFTDALSVALNGDVAKQKDAVVVGTDAKWSGVAGYVNYKLSDRWRTSVRLEYFDDKDGFRTGLVQKWKEATATLAYTPSKNVELRADLRGDKSDKNAFMQTSGSPKDSQQSVGLEALYKF